MKKILLFLTICITLTCCMKDNIQLETWVVWRSHDRVKEFNHAYHCNGYTIGTKLLSRDLDNKINYTEQTDSIIIHNVVPDSVDRDYLTWKHKL